MDKWYFVKQGFLREVLGREYFEYPIFVPQTSLIECELSRGWKCDLETGEKLTNEPVYIIYAKGIDSVEIPNHLREHARWTLINWSKYAPVGTPDEDTVVVFQDEKHLIRYE